MYKFPIKFYLNVGIFYLLYHFSDSTLSRSSWNFSYSKLLLFNTLEVFNFKDKFFFFLKFNYSEFLHCKNKKIPQTFRNSKYKILQFSWFFEKKIAGIFHDYRQESNFTYFYLKNKSISHDYLGFFIILKFYIYTNKKKKMFFHCKHFYVEIPVTYS